MSQPVLSLAERNQSSFELPDVQAETPAVPLVVDEAGIVDLRYPITMQEASGTSHQTVANTSFAASVPTDARGVHMSRFVETLHDWHRRIAVHTLSALLADLSGRLDAQEVIAKFEFPLFLERTAPVSGGSAFVAYDCSLEGRLQSEVADCTLTTRVPITSLCPCSREISDYGAHNQRGSIEISVSFELTEHALLEFGDLIAAADEAGSAPIYSLLKRTDERYVTMQAYENPAFVEDITRAVAAALRSDLRIRAGRVRVVNEESIHSHNAYAAIKWAH
ncbi:MAG: GTP cyclohydrolase I FolE2 [Actinobacteria bacterium]|nr:GTP cyclohydrolase I FolE2 [Actinomycetota bacterium]